MQMVKNFFITLLVVFLALIVFSPKQELYFKLEERLLEQGLKINEEEIDEGLFSLDITHAKIYLKGIHIATIEKVHLFSLFFYNVVSLEDLSLDKSIAAVNASETKGSYVFWNPLEISINSEGSFGGIDGQVSLLDRNVRLDFNDTSHLQMLKSKLKKNAKGWYYETSF